MKIGSDLAKKDLGTMSFRNKGRFQRPLAVSLLALAAMAPAALAVPAAAQDSKSNLSPDTAALVDFLVNKGILTRAQATEFAKDAAQKAAAPRSAASASPAAARSQAAAGTPPDDGALHVQYVPEIVKKQIKDELRHDVMKEARDEHWAAPDALPAWTKRLHLSGDIRVRYEGDFYPSGNDTTGAFPNFNAINTGSPFDVSSISNPNLPPELDADQNRNRFRFRARLGLDASLKDDFSAGLRLATGDTSTPVSPNTTFGSDGGDFSKYAIWLDRAWLKYNPIDNEHGYLSATIGRFANPFFSTDLIYYNDLNFDGVVVQGKVNVGSGITPFLTAGAFPVFNSDLNFASNQTAKYSSTDKYLYAAQAGFDWALPRESSLKLGVAYYDFNNVAGSLSSPCTVVDSTTACDTDASRPSFAQKGNTYMPIRQIVPTADNQFGTTNLFQYYGLATGFRELAVTGRADLGSYDPFHIVLDGEFVENLEFDRASINNVAVNNRGAIPSGATVGSFVGGNLGYFVRATLGDPDLDKRWNWNVNVGYRYLESDAVVDALNDSDFALGGTNLKGYTIGGNLALSPDVYTGLRWMSADSVSGPAYSIDIIQFDIGTRF